MVPSWHIGEKVNSARFCVFLAAAEKAWDQFPQIYDDLSLSSFLPYVRMTLRSFVRPSTVYDTQLYCSYIAIASFHVGVGKMQSYVAVSYTHLTLPTIYSV